MKKVMLQLFRINVHEEDRRMRCPFEERREVNQLDFIFRNCQHCNEIFVLMPPRIPYAIDDRIRGIYSDEGRSYPNDPLINRLNGCPCVRFGIDYVRKILFKKGL